MPIQGLDHINIHTSKREETLRFYTEMLDFQEGFRPPFDFPGAWLYAGERAVIHLVVREGVQEGLEVFFLDLGQFQWLHFWRFVGMRESP